MKITMSKLMCSKQLTMQVQFHLFLPNLIGNTASYYNFMLQNAFFQKVKILKYFASKGTIATSGKK